MERFMRYLLICLTAAFVSWSCSDTPEEPIGPPPPPPPPELKYDIDVKADYAIGSMWVDNPSWFTLVLSDMKITTSETDGSWIVTGAGQIAAFDLRANAAEGEPLPAGKYRYEPDEEAKPEAQTFYAEYVVCDDMGEMVATQFTEAEFSVALSGGIYTFELTGKMVDGKTLRFTHTGAVEFPAEGGGSDDQMFQRMDRDAEATFTVELISYKGKTTSGAGHYDIRFADYEFTSGNDPGYILILPLFATTEGNGLTLTPGTYTVAEEYADPKTYKAGDIQPGFIDMKTLQNKGASLVNTRMENELKQYYGVISSGTVTVSREGDTYTVDADLLDENGFKFKGRYVGTLKIHDGSYYSTLEDDVTADLTGAECNIYYNGEFYEGVEATAWLVQITTGNDGADAVQLEFLTPVRTFEEGLPSGMCGITTNYVPGYSVCLSGTTDGFDFFRSWFLRGLAGTVAENVAPLKEGSVNVSVSGDTHTFTINGYDDAPVGHTVRGTWTGKPIYHDATKPQQAAARMFSRNSRIPFHSNVMR